MQKHKEDVPARDMIEGIGARLTVAVFLAPVGVVAVLAALLVLITTFWGDVHAR